MKQLYFLILFLISADVAAQGAIINVQAGSTQNLLNQVQLGTSRTPPTPAQHTTIYAGVGGRLDAGLICGEFDPKTAVNHALGGIQNSISTLKTIPASVIGSLPGVIFCRALPGVCQLAQTYTGRLERQFNLSVKSCEQMIADATAGGNPYEGLVNISQKKAWQQGQASGQTPMQIQRNIHKARNQGVPWVGGQNHGGAGQPAIKPVRHAAIAGWCHSTGQKSNCKSATKQNEFTKKWKTPQHLERWLVDVTGDTEFAIHQNAPTPYSYVGLGLVPKVKEKEEKIKEKLNEIMTIPDNAFDALTDEDLEELSSDKRKIQLGVLTSLRNDPNKEWLMERLAEEIAVQQTLDEALLARQLLLMGRQEPNLYLNKKYIDDDLDAAIDRLDDEMDLLLTQAEVNARVTRSIEELIVNRGAARQEIEDANADPQLIKQQ